MEDFVSTGPETGDDAGLKESAKEDLLWLGQLSGGGGPGQQREPRQRELQHQAGSGAQPQQTQGNNFLSLLHNI